MTKKRKVNTIHNNGNGHNGNGNGNGYENLAPTYKLLREFKPKTKNQSNYIRCIAESDVVICSGPAGCGKTACAVGISCEHLVNGKVSKIIITRPVIDAGREIGYLPGSANDKLHPYLLPVLEEMAVYFSEYEVQKMITQNIIEIAPLNFMRGRNFNRAFVILDEAQNATFEQIKMFITRLGYHSKCILNGDLRQSDLERNGKLGLQVCIDKLVDVDGVSIVELTASDIIRNPIISRILAKLEA
jgi:phosphate starvation-inducible PhoH-like protein